MVISYEAMPNSVFFRYFKTSPEIIQLAVMLYVRLPLSMRNVEDQLHERGVDFAMKLSATDGTGFAPSSQAIID